MSDQESVATSASGRRTICAVRLSRRFLTPILLVLALTLAGCADTYGVAASYGDEEVSHADLGDEVAAWAVSPDLTALVFGVFQQQPPTGGDEVSAPSALTSVALTIRINGAAARKLIADEGVPTDPALRTEIETEIGRRRGALTDVQLDALINDLAAIFTVQELPASRVFDDVYVSSRYGSFDGAIGFVQPPVGPMTVAPSFEQL